jgi:bifunctional pyridoxal-dependent enzyme with beta-cystathionase and maltose regulon repressor activities
MGRAGGGGGVRKKSEHKKVNYRNKKGNYLCWLNAQQTNKNKRERELMSTQSML